MHFEEVKTILQQTDRAIQYALLSRLFQRQIAIPDLPLLDHAVGQLSEKMKEEYSFFLKTAQRCLENKVQEQTLHVEYAHLFLLPEGVKPYESVYKTNEKMIKQQPWQDVKKFYARQGFILEEGELHPEDHASVELSFMAALIDQGESLAVQKLFFEDHLISWFPALLNDIINNPFANFYKEVAINAQHFMKKEKEWMKRETINT